MFHQCSSLLYYPLHFSPSPFSKLLNSTSTLIGSSLLFFAIVCRGHQHQKSDAWALGFWTVLPPSKWQHSGCGLHHIQHGWICNVCLPSIYKPSFAVVDQFYIILRFPMRTGSALSSWYITCLRGSSLGARQYVSSQTNSSLINFLGRIVWINGLRGEFVPLHLSTVYQ